MTRLDPSSISRYGALELNLRLSRVRLHSVAETQELPLIRSEQNLTTGINWYINSNTRISLNIIHADVQQNGEAFTFLTRAQIEF